jgi:acetyl-CoA acetyltransferase
MATYLVNCRKNASINPNAAHRGNPITREDYLNARMIADPLSILDCDMPVDGCGAVVVTTAERARDLQQRPVYAMGAASGGFKYRHSLIFDLEGYQESAALLARSIWKSSGLGPKDMDFVNLYDGFSLFIYIYLEAFGFCKEGEAYRFIQDGRIELGGELPLNPSGGAMGMGRLHGTPQLLEAVLQLQGRAGERQLRKAGVTLVNSGGPVTGNGAVVLSV